jgi:rubrerythrin
MTDLIKLEQVDADGALRDGAETVEGDSRADFFRKAAIGGTGMLGGGVLLAGFPQIAMGGKPSRRQDVSILNFALTLEFLEDEFYKQALRNINFTVPNLERVTRVVSRHESIHVRFLKRTLRRAAIRKPKFDFGSAVTDEQEFLNTAQKLEDTGVTAYLGQAGRIKQKAVLTAAGTILAIEARHAAFIGEINGNSFAPRAFDRPVSGRKIKAKIAPFIV